MKQMPVESSFPATGRPTLSEFLEDRGVDRCVLQWMTSPGLSTPFHCDSLHGDRDVGTNGRYPVPPELSSDRGHMTPESPSDCLVGISLSVPHREELSLSRADVVMHVVHPLSGVNGSLL